MTGASDGYIHPASGREYREGDPAHRFAELGHVLAEECRQFLYHYEQRIDGRDYLDQHLEWQSDPDRIARAMAHTIAELDKAYSAVIIDRTMHVYGLGKRDEEWERKYGSAHPARSPG